MRMRNKRYGNCTNVLTRTPMQSEIKKTFFQQKGRVGVAFFLAINTAQGVCRIIPSLALKHREETGKKNGYQTY